MQLLLHAGRLSLQVTVVLALLVWHDTWHVPRVRLYGIA